MDMGEIIGDAFNRVSVLSEILHGVNFFDFVFAIGY